jgi:hypothetical protein
LFEDTKKGNDQLRIEEQTIQCPQEKYNDLQNTMQSSNTNTNLTINQGSVQDLLIGLAGWHLGPYNLQLNSIKITILNHYYCFSAEINVRENRRDNAEYEIQRDMQYWAHEDKPKAQKTTKGRLKQLWLIINSLYNRYKTMFCVERVQHSQTERILLLLTEPVNNCALSYTSLPV